MCSLHHTGAFQPKRSSIHVSRRPLAGTVRWRIDETCDGCATEREPLCVKYCAYDALSPCKEAAPTTNGTGRRHSRGRRGATAGDRLGALAGRILRVDLGDGTMTVEKSAEYATRTLGGRGTNSLLLLNEIEPGTTWDDPRNLLCFGAGSLVGTAAPGACRTDVATVNVFHGGKGSANVGGFWGAELKYAGFDHVVIRGKAEAPVYLFIHDGRAEIRDASWLWGKTTWETETLLRERLGDERIVVACIGPAGENRVRGSAVIVDTAKAAGGSGVGCVMGDKKLKAVVVRGTGSISVADPDGFMAAIDKAMRQCAANVSKVSLMRRWGPARYEDPDFEAWDTCLVVRNGQDDHWPRENRVRLMNAETGVPSMRRRSHACASCPTGCMPYMVTPGRQYPERRGEGFWTNSIWSVARFDVADPETAATFWLQANELGLDTDYVTSGLAWLFECYEQGLIGPDETDGLGLTWGNGPALIELARRLAYREGIGDLIADGLVEAARDIGHGADYLLSHIKGQPSMEPFRIPKGWGLGVVTSPVAGRHLRGSVAGPERFGPRDLDFDSVHYRNQAEAVVWQARTKELEDALGICNYVGTWSGGHFLTPDDFAAFVRAGLGIDVSAHDLMERYAPAGRDLERAFNAIHTEWTRKDDVPPPRFRQEPVLSGPYRGFRADEDEYDAMVGEFYALSGWDARTGAPTPERLEATGFPDVAAKLRAVASQHPFQRKEPESTRA